MNKNVESKDEKTIQKTIDKICSGLMNKVADQSRGSNNKITVVGVGHVGMACALSLLTQNVTNEIALIDVAEDHAKGEMMDLQQASCLLGSPKIQSGTDYSISANSRVCVVTAGARQVAGESRQDLVQRNLEVFKHIIPPLVLYNPDAVFLVVTNPVDILAYVTWTLSGLPIHRVIGSGTNLDTSRLRLLVSQELGLAPESCHGWVIGEHGDTSVAVWSGVNVAGVRLPRHPLGQVPEGEPDCFSLLHQRVIDSANKVIQLKGYTCWAIATSVTNICQAIVNNVHSVHAVSTAVKGIHGIKHDVFLSLPCSLGKDGVTDVIVQPLRERELQQLRSSADTVHETIKGLHFL